MAFLRCTLPSLQSSHPSRCIFKHKTLRESLSSEDFYQMNQINDSAKTMVHLTLHLAQQYSHQNTVL